MFGTAAILAGGKSSRMGFDKQMLMDDGKRLLEKIIATLREEFTDIIVISAKPELYEGMDVRVYQDTYQDRGPLAGVHAALTHANSQYVYLLACDMPVVNLPFIRYMKQRLRETGASICACKLHDRMETFNTFYSRDLLPDVTHRLETGNSSLFRFIDGNQPCVIRKEDAAHFDQTLSMFTNINTRSEYEKYLGAALDTTEQGDLALVDKLDIVRYIGGEYVSLRDLMVHETALRMEINGDTARTLYCSPKELRELVVGHLYTQGCIRTMADILSVEVDEENGRAVVRLVSEPTKADRTPVSDETVFDPKILLDNQQHFYDQSTLQKATAGTHCCALCDDSGTYFSCIDISRHNCLDKLAGKALISGISLTNKYIITSGRIPMDMIHKIVSVGVPMIVSRSTPTIAAVETARAAGITLLGFSRENRFNIYSAAYRLKGCSLRIANQ